MPPKGEVSLLGKPTCVGFFKCPTNQVGPFYRSERALSRPEKIRGHSLGPKVPSLGLIGPFLGQRVSSLGLRGRFLGPRGPSLLGLRGSDKTLSRPEKTLSRPEMTLSR